MDGGRIRWSDLPSQLWPAIGKRLNTYIDVVRFRSVCRSWRDSLPPFHAISPLSPLDLPSPIDDARLPPDALLLRRIIYRVSPSDHDRSSISTSPCAEGWLAKVENTELGKMRFLHPLCKRYIKYKSYALRKELNLLDFRIYELAKTYSLCYIGGALVPGITKVVVFPDSAWIDIRNCTIIAVYEEGKLGFAKHGDEKWTLIDDQNFHYDDVIVYKEQPYAVDRWGTIFWIDSSMSLVQFSPPLCGFGDQKHVVVCSGELYVIDRFLDNERTFWNAEIDHIRRLHNPIDHFDDSSPKVVDFKVYRLDQEWGRWVEVSTLGNRAFVLGNDCGFSIWAPDFEGFKANCIYFTDVNDGDEAAARCRHGHGGRRFDLEERRIWKIASVHDQTQIYRPPPIWLDYEALGNSINGSNHPETYL